MDNIELLSNAQIDNMNKSQSQAYAKKLTQVYKNMYVKLFDPDQGIIPKMQKDLEKAASTNQYLIEKLIEVEKVSYSNAQYARKETIEFTGFDASNAPEDIEKKVLSVINLIKDDDEPEYTNRDIQACHRLKNPKIVICKFVFGFE